MKLHRFQALLVIPAVLLIGALTSRPAANVRAQDGATQTPAGGGSGAFITVLYDEPYANIRLGPSSIVYPRVGRLYPGESAPALGRSPGGDWIQIEIASSPGGEFVAAPNNRGWVYAALVQLSGGPLQIVEPPPTPVPPATVTIDPTLAAQFTIQSTATRLPTFTPPPTLVVQTYTQPAARNPEAIPLATIIMSLGGFGFLTLLASLFVRRR